MGNKQQTKAEKEYSELVKQVSPKSHTIRDCLRAFWVGGLICCVGQGINDIYQQLLGMDKKAAAALTSVTLVFIGATLTGLGLYDNIGKYAGAGSIVPITGFSNSIVAPAIEFKHEGYIMGIGSKLFTIAGPVLVYGISTSNIVGLIYLLLEAIKGGA